MSKIINTIYELYKYKFKKEDFIDNKYPSFIKTTIRHFIKNIIKYQKLDTSHKNAQYTRTKTNNRNGILEKMQNNSAQHNANSLERQEGRIKSIILRNSESVSNKINKLNSKDISISNDLKTYIDNPVANFKTIYDSLPKTVKDTGILK